MCLENPTCNGNVGDLEYMKKLYELGKKHNMAVHYDGARIFNAASYLNVSAKDLAQYCDSV